MSTGCKGFIPPLASASSSGLPTHHQFTAPDSPFEGVDDYDGQLRSGIGYSWRHVRLHGTSGLRLALPDPKMTRIAFLLASTHGQAEFRVQRDLPGAVSPLLRRMCIVPARETVWLCSEWGGMIEFGALAFDHEALEARLGERFGHDILANVRLNFSNEPLWRLGRRLAEESRRSLACSELYLDSCVVLLLIELLREGQGDLDAPMTRGLSRRQLKRVTEHIEENLSSRIPLRVLSDLTRLSASRFSQAFKRATGTSPHRWHLAARIRRAQQLLLDSHQSISTVAIEVGFSDQAHFTRVFRNLVGVTPSAWRRERRG